MCSFSLATIHIASRYLADAGLVVCTQGEATEERGGRARLNLALTDAGLLLMKAEE